MSYDGALANCEELKTPIGMPIKDRLLRSKAQLEKQIVDINRALELYEKNPDVEELTNLVGMLRY